MPKLSEEQKELNRLKRQENKRLKEIEEQKQRVINQRIFDIKDVRYSDLSKRDRWQFRDKNVAVAQVQNMPEKDILELFLTVNTTGKPISEDHLVKVRNMFKSVK